MTAIDTLCHLLKKGQRNVTELSRDELVVGRPVEVLVPPQGRKAAPIGEADLLAHGVVTLVVEESHQQCEQTVKGVRRVISPARVEEAEKPSYDWHGKTQLQPRTTRARQGGARLRC